jgi:hypothetical protein
MSEKSDVDKEVDEYLRRVLGPSSAPAAASASAPQEEASRSLENAFRILQAEEPKPKEGRQPVQTVLNVSPEAEQAVAGAVGAYAGSKIRPALTTAFPTAQQREAEGLRRIREALLTQRTYQELLQEEMARLGIRPERTGMTSGEKWSANWAGQERPGVGGVPEAAAAHQRSKGQGKITGRMSKMWAPAGPNEPSALVDRLMYRSAQVAQQQAAAEQASQRAMQAAAQQIAQSTPGPLSQVGRALTGPKIGGALGGLGAGLSAYEAYQRYQEGDRSGAVLAALGALGSGASMIPALSVPGLVVGAATAPALHINDLIKGRAQSVYKPEEAADLSNYPMP